MASNYTPRLLSGEVDLTSLAHYVRQELQFLERALQTLQIVQLTELNAEPERPRTGMIALADGTNWNPGSGAGFYGYYAGAWHKLG